MYIYKNLDGDFGYFVVKETRRLGRHLPWPGIWGRLLGSQGPRFDNIFFCLYADWFDFVNIRFVKKKLSVTILEQPTN